MVVMKENVDLLHSLKNYPADELEFMEKCAHIVLKCRQVLKWTWVINYFSQQKLQEEGAFDLFSFH